MKKALIIYEEERILTADFNHPKSGDYLHYRSIIRIKDSGYKVGIINNHKRFVISSSLAIWFQVRLSALRWVPARIQLKLKILL